MKLRAIDTGCDGSFDHVAGRPVRFQETAVKCVKRRQGQKALSAACRLDSKGNSYGASLNVAIQPTARPSKTDTQSPY